MVGTPLVELLVIDVIVILSIVIFERSLKVQASKLVQYDRIDLIKPEHEGMRASDGLKEIECCDFCENVAFLVACDEAYGVK